MDGGKGLFSIVYNLFNDFFKNLLLTKDSNKVRIKYLNRLEKESDPDGTIDRNKLNKLTDDYVKELEDLANTSGMSGRAIKKYIETINKTRKIW